MEKWLELYPIYALSTSSHSCHRTTLLNTEVLNFYITQLINSCTEIHFIEPGVKVNGAYYRDNLLAKKLLPDIFRKSQGWVISFNRTHRPGATSTRHRRFLEAKCARLRFSNTVFPEFTGSEF